MGRYEIIYGEDRYFTISAVGRTDARKLFEAIHRDEIIKDIRLLESPLDSKQFRIIYDAFVWTSIQIETLDMRIKKRFDERSGSSQLLQDECYRVVHLEHLDKLINILRMSHFCEIELLLADATQRLEDKKESNTSAWEMYGGELCAGDMMNREKEIEIEIKYLKKIVRNDNDKID